MSRALINLYTAIMAVGASTYVAGLFIGQKLPPIIVFGSPLFRLSSSLQYAELVRKRTVWITTVAVIGMFLSFAIMGYLPMFAEDPLQAKYFHDQYRPGYLRAIWLFIPSLSAFLAYVPIFMLVISRRFKVRYLVILLAGFCSVALILHRGDLGGPVLLGIGFILVASKRKRAIPAFLVIGVLVSCVGAMMNYFLALYFDVGLVKIGGEENTIWNLMAGGVPDVHEGLTFLQSFMIHGQYTIFRTWLGGLVPLQYKWNPGIWALTVAFEMTHEEASNFVSGGLRVAIPIMGFACLDWPGAIIFSFTIGLMTGYIVTFAKRRVLGSPVEIRATIIAFAFALIASLDSPNWRSLPPLLTLMPLIYPVRFRFKRSSPPSPTPA